MHTVKGKGIKDFENDPVWHARKLQGDDIIIGKKDWDLSEERKFGKIINQLAKKDKKIVLLVADIGYGIFDDFRKEHPDRFFNLGICEQSINFI